MSTQPPVAVLAVLVVLGEEIGRGAFSRVHLARVANTGEVCVLKERLDSYDAMSEVALLRKSCVHPCVIDMRDAFVVDRSKVCILMERASHDLRHELDCEKLDPRRESYYAKRATQYIAQIALGLEFLHSHDITHGDVKPRNLFVLRDGRVVLGDFSVSKKQLPRSRGDEVWSKNWGTPQYMAPEIIKGLPYGTKADMWSFGLCVYEILTLNQVSSLSNFSQVRNEIFSMRSDPDGGFPEQVDEATAHEWVNTISFLVEVDPGKRASARRIIQEGFLMKDLIRAVWKHFAEGHGTLELHRAECLLMQLKRLHVASTA